MKNVENALVSQLDDTSDEWKTLTARIAWLFWLTDYRMKHPSATTEEELLVWKTEANEYRKYIRKALRVIRKDGIEFYKL